MTRGGWLVAPQELKGTLSAAEAARAMAEGARAGAPGLALDVAPLADGGPGTLEALLSTGRGERRPCAAEDARGRPLEAAFGRFPAGLGDGDARPTAVVELALASGLGRLADGERDAVGASTWGTGRVVRAALEAGCARVVVGLGGSATTDGGAGLLQALGVRLLDAAGRELPRGGGALAALAHVDTTGLHPRAHAVAWDVACDVEAPLLGPRGAARLFGPQKGAGAADVERLEAALGHLAHVVARDVPGAAGREDAPGAGAAGGTGYALLAVLRARFTPGAALVMRALRLEERLAGCTGVLTAEGRLDAQSALGKGPVAVARLARARGLRAVAWVGALGPGAPVEAFDAVHVLPPHPPAVAAVALHDAVAAWARALP